MHTRPAAEPLAADTASHPAHAAHAPALRLLNTADAPRAAPAWS